MVKNVRTLILGILIIVIPFLGFTRFWKNSFLVIIGAVMIVTSLKITLPRRGVVAKRIRKKEKITPVFMENSPIIEAPTPQAVGKEISSTKNPLEK